MSFEVDNDLTSFLAQKAMITSDTLVIVNNTATTKNNTVITVQTDSSTSICENYDNKKKNK